jgi:hypothetical protein
VSPEPIFVPEFPYGPPVLLPPIQFHFDSGVIVFDFPINQFLQQPLPSAGGQNSVLAIDPLDLNGPQVGLPAITPAPGGNTIKRNFLGR